jgi:hypothetical protein
MYLLFNQSTYLYSALEDQSEALHTRVSFWNECLLHFANLANILRRGLSSSPVMWNML